MKLNYCAALMVLICVGSGCANSKRAGSPHPDFDRLYLSGKAIQGALMVGVTYSDYGGLLRGMATEISVLQDKLKFEGDRHVGEDALLKDYSKALEAYTHANTAWKDWVESQKYSFSGSKDLKYYKDSRFLTVTYDLLDHKEISMEFVQAIWSKAGERLGRANEAYYGVGNSEAKNSHSKAAK